MFTEQSIINIFYSKSRLNSLSVLSIGRDLVNDCDSFKSKVMEMFIKKKERRMHFTYKGKK